MNQNPVLALLEGLVDYAGLFPPAKLPMDRTVANYQDYRESPQSWMLGRLIVPVGRLHEFEEAAGGMLPRDRSTDAWQISALLPPADAPMTRDLSGAMREIEGFNLRHASAELGFAHISTLEVRCNFSDSIEALAKMLTPAVTAYVEIPIDEQLEANIGVIERYKDRLRAKIRTGGITEDLIPTTESVIRFVSCCVDRSIAFKATAGLHHPIRAKNALTYERDPDVVYMHGFLNLLLATGGLLTGKLSLAEATTLLRETDASAISVDPITGWMWGDMTLGMDDISATRQMGLNSFGSCSFIEPVEDLQALGHSLSLTTSL